MTRLSESGISRVGTIIIFIIVALVLAGLVWLGYNFIQDRGEQVRRDEATEIARENLEEQSETPVISEDESENESENGSGTGTGTTNEEEDDAEQPSTTPVTSTAPEAMPQTGPELAHVLTFTALIGATTFFIVSRKAAREL